jgi:beta-lactam-binding protein with PASTA domain
VKKLIRQWRILKEQGFGYKIDSVYVQDVAPGTIVEQDPDPGTNVKEGRVIYLTMVTLQAPNVSPARSGASQLP